MIPERILSHVVWLQAACLDDEAFAEANTGEDVGGLMEGIVEWVGLVGVGLCCSPLHTSPPLGFGVWRRWREGLRWEDSPQCPRQEMRVPEDERVGDIVGVPGGVGVGS